MQTSSTYYDLLFTTRFQNGQKNYVESCKLCL